MGHIAAISSLLQLSAEGHRKLARHKAANLMTALDTVAILLAPSPEVSFLSLHLHGIVRDVHLPCLVWDTGLSA
jgi:hypothetical protein